MWNYYIHVVCFSVRNITLRLGGWIWLSICWPVSIFVAERSNLHGGCLITSVSSRSWNVNYAVQNAETSFSAFPILLSCLCSFLFVMNEWIYFKKKNEWSQEKLQNEEPRKIYYTAFSAIQFRFWFLFHRNSN